MQVKKLYICNVNISLFCALICDAAYVPGEYIWRIYNDRLMAIKQIIPKVGLWVGKFIIHYSMPFDLGLVFTIKVHVHVYIKLQKSDSTSCFWTSRHIKKCKNLGASFSGYMHVAYTRTVYKSGKLYSCW